MRRIRSGWIALTLLLGFMFVSNLVGYFQRKPHVNELGRDFEQQIKYELAFTPGQKLTTAARVLDRVTTRKAARYRLAVALFEKADPKPQDLTTLTFAVDDPLVAIAQEKDQKKREALAKELPEWRFEYRLAQAAVRRDGGDKDAVGKLYNPLARAGIVLLVVAGLGAILAGLVLWGFFLSRPDWLPRLGAHPAEPMEEGEDDRFAGRAALLFATVFVVAPMLLLPLRSALPGKVFSLAAELIGLAAVFWIGALKLGPERSMWKRLGVDGRNVFQRIGWGFAGFLATAPVVTFMMVVALNLFKFLPDAEHPSSVDVTNSANPASVLIVLLLATVIAPIIEETMFRGLIVPALGQRLNAAAAIMVGNLMFAVIHPTGIPVWPALMSVGCVSSLLVLQTRSVLPSMVMHGLYNGAIMGLVALMASL